MSYVLAKKSSFTLPVDEVKRVKRLKSRLGLRSNTAVVRKALEELEAKVDQTLLRRQYAQASRLVRIHNREDMKALDELADEGI